MITILSDNFNSFSKNFQKNYDDIVFRLNTFAIVCPVCGSKGLFNRHGFYSRKIYTSRGLTTVRILRIRCRSCGSTHAIMVSAIVPYSHLPFPAHIYIAQKKCSKDRRIKLQLAFPGITESNIRYVRSQFRMHWLERIRTFGHGNISASHLIMLCFLNFRRQFMQIKQHPNILFPLTT